MRHDLRHHQSALNTSFHIPHEAIMELLQNGSGSSDCDDFDECDNSGGDAREETNSTARNDSMILQGVLGALRAEPTIDLDALEVHVADGEVTLTGYADGYGDQWLIESAASGVEGVRSLAVELEVGMPEAGVRTDEDIRRECEHALGMTVPGANHAIKVRVSSGSVTLTGCVDWGYERSSSEDIVSGLTGVTAVDDQIEVHPLDEGVAGLADSEAVSSYDSSSVRSVRYSYAPLSYRPPHGHRAIPGGGK